MSRLPPLPPSPRLSGRALVMATRAMSSPPVVASLTAVLMRKMGVLALRDVMPVDRNTAPAIGFRSGLARAPKTAR